MKRLLLLSILLITGFSIGQVPVIEWQKSLGGTGFDYASSIQETSDGGYIVAGRSTSNDGDVTGNHGGYDFWVVKLDINGNITWQKSLGGSNVDYAFSIQETSDNGYIVAGRSSSNDGDVTGNHGSDDFWIVKLDINGNFTWQKSLGGSNQDYANSIQQTTDGGYIITGFSESNNGDVTGNHGLVDFWIVKLDINGNITWQKSLGGSNDDRANSIQETSDGGYIVAGRSSSNDGDVTGNHGSDDFWIVKLDINGNITWEKSLGGTGTESALSIQQTLDGGYIVAGRSTSNDGDLTGNYGGYDIWIVKLDINANITWQKSLGGTGAEYANSIQETSDGGYIVAGYSQSNDGDVTANNGSFDFWIIKLDVNGNITWEKSLGGSDFDSAHSIHQTTDGGYIVAGSSLSNDGDVTVNYGNNDCWIVKFYECTNTSGSETVTECNSYTWATNGQTYTQSGQYTSVLTNQDGCDSTVTLNLTITNSNTGSETVTECDSYTWNADGQTYTQSGQYTSVLTNQDGCDSTVTLNLTITNSNTGSETVTECDSYTWSTNGQTYTQSGQYTEVLSNQDGCDSTITLNLTIETVDITTQPVDQNVVVGNNAQFTVVTSASNPTYQWQMDNGTGYMDLTNAGQFSGVDSDMLTVSNVTLGQNNTLFRCIVSENSNCSDTTDVAVLTVEDNTGLYDLNKNIFNVYPNPTSNSFTISSEKVINSEFTIIDSQGREVLTGSMNGQEHTIDISKLSKGVYSVVFDNTEYPVVSVIKE